MSFLLKWQSSFRKSSRANLDGLFCAYSNSSSTLTTLSLNSFISRPAAFSSSILSSPSPSYSFSMPSSSFSSTPIFPSMAMMAAQSQVALKFLAWFCSIVRIFLCLKAACRVLFFLMKQILSSPSHQRKSISGRGFLGSMRTILLSTLGGGLKLFLPTLIRWSTFDSSCTFTLSLQQRSDPGLAINLCANSFWNIKTAHLNMGFWASSLKTRGELIWQGIFATQISKKGSSTDRTSAGMRVNLLAYSEYLNLLESSATMRGSISMAITFFALSRSRAVRLPVPGPISSTTSVGRMEDLATISERMWELMRMCWPQDLLKTMPVRFTVCFSFIIVETILYRIARTYREGEYIGVLDLYVNVIYAGWCSYPFMEIGCRSLFLLFGFVLGPEDEEAEEDVSVHQESHDERGPIEQVIGYFHQGSRQS